MSNSEEFDTPNADVIIRTSGPPERDFRVHKLILSLASPVFKDTFSLPQRANPVSSDLKGPKAEEMDIVHVTDPPRALCIVLKMIYPFTPPSLHGNLDILVECLAIADKYEINMVTARLRGVLSRINASQALRVYGIASRFELTDIVESASNHILTSVDLIGIPRLPDDFEFVSATAYHQLVRKRAKRLEAAAAIVQKVPFKSMCVDCPRGDFVEEVYKLNLGHLIMKGTPLAARACWDAWVKAYGLSSECEKDCVGKFIRTAVSMVCKELVYPPRNLF